MKKQKIIKLISLLMLFVVVLTCMSSVITCAAGDADSTSSGPIDSIKDAISEKFSAEHFISDLLKNVLDYLATFSVIQPVKQLILDDNIIDLTDLFDPKNDQGFQHWFILLSKFGYAFIPLIMLKVAYLMMASFSNPSYKNELKDFLQASFLYFIVLFAGRELVMYALDINNAIVSYFAVQWKEYAYEGWKLDQLNLNIIALLFDIIVFIISIFFWIYLKLMFFLRYLGIGVFYMLLPIGAILLYFKKFSKVLEIMVNELIALIFMQAIYAMTFMLLYSAMAYTLTKMPTGFYASTAGSLIPFNFYALLATGTPEHVTLGPLAWGIFLFMLIKTADKLMKMLGLNIAYTPGAKDAFGAVSGSAATLAITAAYSAGKISEWKGRDTSIGSSKKSKEKPDLQSKLDAAKRIPFKGKTSSIPENRKLSANKNLLRNISQKSLGENDTNTSPLRRRLVKNTSLGENASLGENTIKGAKTHKSPLKAAWDTGADIYNKGIGLKNKGLVKLTSSVPGRAAAFALASGFKLGLLGTGTDADFNKAWDNFEKMGRKTKNSILGRSAGDLEFSKNEARDMGLKIDEHVFYDGEGQCTIFDADGKFKRMYKKDNNGNFKRVIEPHSQEIKNSLGWKGYVYDGQDEDNGNFILTEYDTSGTFLSRVAESNPKLKLDGDTTLSTETKNVNTKRNVITNGSIFTNQQTRFSDERQAVLTGAVDQVFDMLNTSDQRRLTEAINNGCNNIAVKTDGRQLYVTSVNKGTGKETEIISTYIADDKNNLNGEMHVKAFRANTENGQVKIEVLDKDYQKCKEEDIYTLTGAISDAKTKDLQKYQTQVLHIVSGKEEVKNALIEVISKGNLSEEEMNKVKNDLQNAINEINRGYKVAEEIDVIINTRADKPDYAPLLVNAARSFMIDGGIAQFDATSSDYDNANMNEIIGAWGTLQDKIKEIKAQVKAKEIEYKKPADAEQAVKAYEELLDLKKELEKYSAREKDIQSHLADNKLSWEEKIKYMESFIG